MRRGWTTATLVLAALLVVSCGGGSDETGASDSVDAVDPAPDAETTGDDAPAGNDEEAPMTGEDPEAFAVADAAQRTGVDPADVIVVANEQVTWPDGSLGCPQPDQFSTQALVEGYRVVVEVDGERFHYHGQTGQPPAYCANPSEPAADRGGVVDR